MKKKKPRRGKEPPRTGAIAVFASQDRKTGICCATYSSQIGCPVTCPYLGDGCNLEHGPGGIVTRRLNENAAYHRMSIQEVAEQEAYAIGRLPLGHDIRSGIVGDKRTNEAAYTVSVALEDYVRRTNDWLRWSCDGDVREKLAWAYTHAWRTVDRTSWGTVSVLASCETLWDVDTAWEKGYAAAIVMGEFPFGHRRWKEPTGDGRSEYVMVPCLYDTRGVQCVDCRLCMRDQYLREKRIVIVFRASGAKRNTVVRTLKVLNGEMD